MKFKQKFALFLFSLLAFFNVNASHIMGGQITWKCQGGAYVFELEVYRDCNGADINAVSETIKVWNHPTITSISLPFVARTDMSPSCSPVAGSPSPLTCGSGPNSGNGIGAIERVLYRSLPINLPGIPPSQGWIFTYDNFSRSGSITNLVNPSTYGITLTSKMFASGTAGVGCVDSSPQFLQAPFMVSCAGSPYVYNMNAVDPDLDSIHIDFGKPLNNFTGAYNPPSSPQEIPFAGTFAYNNPTPDVGMNASNIPCTVNPSSGELNFTSYNIGNYVVKLVVQSYRNGQLIAEVDREMQIVVASCSNLNNAPNIAGPFAGSFTTTVNAGDLVNFTLASTDLEVLQDGSPQKNLLSASGQMFGTNFTSNAGCGIAPCATLNTTPIIIGNQGVSTNFSWQTSCDHLENQYGIVANVVPYHFVFKVQDDYCQVPRVTYATVTINVVNPGIVPVPKIDCIQTLPNNDIQITWTPATDPNGTFVNYKIYSVQNGLLGTINNINSSTFTVPAINDNHDFYISTLSGCNGNLELFSDTVSNIFLDLSNPSDGTAILQWNAPSTPATALMNSYYYIYREYPVGTWNIIDSVPYGTNVFRDTVDICSAFLNYQIVLKNTPCNYTSNIEGDNFEDMQTPYMPVIQSVSIDTISGNLQISWNQNYAQDTYGYIIYTFDANGFIYEIDTVWGRANTSYTYSTNTNAGELSYSVAAFDSCFTNIIPPTYQTSAKADVHTTMFLTNTFSVCDKQINLDWTPYVGWTGTVNYEIFGRKNNGLWESFGTTTNSMFAVTGEPLQSYCFAVKASNASGAYSFSNLSCRVVVSPTPPAYHYLSLATVSGDEIYLKHYIENTSAVKEVSFQKKNRLGVFEQIARIPVTSNIISYTDTDVDVYRNTYTYRVQVIDSCDLPGAISNIAQNVLLTEQHEDVSMKVSLNWTAYEDFNGSILGYQVYRSFNNNFSYVGLALSADGNYAIEDDLSNFNFNGKVCYLVDAIESNNIYNFAEQSRSNEVCIVFEPLIFVPNAFTPDGLNPIFKPEVNIADITQYTFSVFDRYGSVIYQTNDVNEGWNGHVPLSTKDAQTGVYVYMVEVHDGGGSEHVKRGTVTLLR